ncbi:hypothetical protein Nwi_1728 [Nitrobacter winogradskyi Nb-255]|uniref:Uncharacterized protein n=1 Tax=Nitrobacter winogradskyi (strain ATCC 25391 / DSM 10237 / CIP 104748 / NCIMB 11846 / Nb-255) TaxID=323098 RepID=Q3SRV2_NITWN|nr:hypothetical protein [Nitrobacter winogradskyi]ABA04989.1 hypothetical protein Nwi_1728 [Nitrobacter winogradskyi Nb-255]
MMISRSNTRNDILSLETAATAARGGFACLFSSSDEYEQALIAERHARGRYTSTRRLVDDGLDCSVGHDRPLDTASAKRGTARGSLARVFWLTVGHCFPK